MQNTQLDFIDALFAEHPSSDDIYPLAHLSIYRNNILYTLENALLDTYPLIKQLVGEDFFHHLAQAYIERYPSRQSHLQYYGEYFHEFLAEFPAVSHLIYLPEVAKFEWACQQLYYAPHYARLDAHKLQSFPEESHEELRLEWHPAAELIAFAYPMLEIIALCKGERKEDIDLATGGIQLLLHRFELEILIHPLTASEWVFLTAIKAGQSLKAAYHAALLKEPSFDLTKQLMFCMEQHIIVDAYLPNIIPLSNRS